jgi:hypothetical protein
MTTQHAHSPLETARESFLLALAGAGILFWAPVLILWTAILMVRDRIERTHRVG